jgi:hypothetical protein
MNTSRGLMCFFLFLCVVSVACGSAGQLPTAAATAEPAYTDQAPTAELRLRTPVATVGSSHTDEPVAPDGVTYVEASEAANAVARKSLATAFSGKRVSIEDLVAQGVAKNHEVFFGTFLTQKAMNISGYHPSAFQQGSYKLQLGGDEGVAVNAPFIAAMTKSQAESLSAVFSDIYGSPPSPNIRKLTKEEMALVWFYIGWDMVEPIYVAETAGRKIVFDFGPDASYLEWIEDITNPCFRLSYQGGGVPCMCTVVVSQDNKYEVMFRPQSQCSD